MLPLVGLTAGAMALAGCSSSKSGSSADTGANTGTNTGAGSPSSSGGGSSAAFKVNLDDCTDPAAAQKKVTGSWKVGYSAPLSGPVAGVVTYALDGYKARIAAENAKGGINGVKIDVEYKDDAFTPDRAKTNVTQFLESDHVDSVTTFGTGSVSAMADDQNAACVPMIYPSSSVAQYRDISQYPWTLQFLPNTDSEAGYDVSVIKGKFPSGAKVGIAENQTASGKGESDAFQKAAKAAGGVDVVKIAPSTDPNAAATAMKQAAVDVVYIAGITNDCGPDVQAMARIGFTPKLVIAPSNCADQTGWIAAGAAANGVIVPAWSKNPADPAQASDAGVQEYLSQVTTDDKNNAITVSGWIMADLMINTLKQAAASPAGLSHVGVIQAARDQSYACPMLLNGVKWTSTPTKMIGFDAFQSQTWDAAAKAFKPTGALVPITS